MPMKCLRNIAIAAIFCAIWQLIIWLAQLPPYILPTPQQTLHTLYQQAPLIAANAAPTIIEALSGLLLATLFGCSLALNMAFFRPLRVWLTPLLIISQALPIFAIAPLLVIWLGYGMASKIATTVLMLFFPIASSFFDGLRRTESGWLDLARTMNASRWQVLWHIRVPAALPNLASGLRVAAAAAPIGAVIGEWVGASNGLGFLMLNANARMQIDLMFAVLFVIVIFGIALYFSVDKLLRRVIFWQQESDHV
jgi:putative hydroxymethylpyrimidine transport system permease protein